MHFLHYEKLRSTRTLDLLGMWPVCACSAQGADAGNVWCLLRNTQVLNNFFDWETYISIYCVYCWPWRNHSVAFKVDRQGINIQTKYLGRGLSSHNTLVVKITRDVCKDDEDLHMSRDTCCFTYCTRSSHNAAVVVAIIVVAAAAAVTCLHININSEVQRRMKISDSWLYYKQR